MLNEIGEADLFDNPRITDFKGRVFVKPYYTPTLIYDPVTRTAPQIIDGDEIKTKKQAVTYNNDAIGLAEDAIFLAPGRIEVLQIFAEGAMSAVAANRNISVLVTHIAAQIVVVPWYLMATSNLLLTANENGSIFFPGGTDTTWTNIDALIAAVADENILPLFLEEDDSIICQSDNDQLGDILGVTVWYRTAE